MKSDWRPLKPIGVAKPFKYIWRNDKKDLNLIVSYNIWNPLYKGRYDVELDNGKGAPRRLRKELHDKTALNFAAEYMERH